MNRIQLSIISVLLLICLTGCVERELTINTEPQGALVRLNDEEIGFSPVTVSFNWYGDYRVRITKEGYNTLKTHRNLERPLHDWPPFDFFVQCLYPGRITDSYEWTFSLKEQSFPPREKLLKDAVEFKKQLK